MVCQTIYVPGVATFCLPHPVSYHLAGRPSPDAHRHAVGRRAGIVKSRCSCFPKTDNNYLQATVVFSATGTTAEPTDIGHAKNEEALAKVSVKSCERAAEEGLDPIPRFIRCLKAYYAVRCVL